MPESSVPIGKAITTVHGSYFKIDAGKHDCKPHGKQINGPVETTQRPDSGAPCWHNEQCFKGTSFAPKMTYRRAMTQEDGCSAQEPPGPTIHR